MAGVTVDVEDDRPTGLVLTAGGARGAYQAGALAELLPAMHAAGARPRLLVGESVGAINAAVLASVAHLPPQAQGEALVGHWASASRAKVLRPLWRHLPTVALRYGGETVGVPGLALRGLLSVTPLRRTLERDVDWRRLHANVTTGVLSAVAVTATAVTTGRSVTFVEGTDDRLPPDGDNLEYHGAHLGVDHVVGSGAIPALFPPAWIGEPAAAAAWYVDGCTRLHTPLRPALDLGAGRLAVVGTTGLQARDRRDLDEGAVDLGDTAVTLLQAMVEDSLRRDVHRLDRINAHLVGDDDEHAAVQRLRAARGRPAYRHVPYVAVAPEDPFEVGDIAMEVFRSRYRGWRALRDPDMEALHRLLGGDSPLQGELLSFVLFDEVYHERLVALGRRDARRVLADAGPLFATARTG